MHFRSQRQRQMAALHFSYSNLARSRFPASIAIAEIVLFYQSTSLLTTKFKAYGDFSWAFATSTAADANAAAVLLNHCQLIETTRHTVLIVTVAKKVCREK